MGCAGKDLWGYEIGSIPVGRGGRQRVTDGRRNLSLCRCACSAIPPGLFMTLSAAEAGGLRCCPLRCLTAGKAHSLQTYSTFVIKASLPAKAVSCSFPSHCGSDSWPLSLPLTSRVGSVFLFFKKTVKCKEMSSATEEVHQC